MYLKWKNNLKSCLSGVYGDCVEKKYIVSFFLVYDEDIIWMNTRKVINEIYRIIYMLTPRELGFCFTLFVFYGRGWINSEKNHHNFNKTQFAWCLMYRNKLNVNHVRIYALKVAGSLHVYHGISYSINPLMFFLCLSKK